VVPRQRLEQLLEAAWERRVTLVVAGGGYGKTTALRQLTTGRPAHWLALTASDRQVESLSAHIAETLAAQSGDRTVITSPSTPGAVAGAALGASDRHGLAQAHAAAICAGLDSRNEPVMLVLDDVDQLSDEDSSTPFLSALCLLAPPQLRVVLGGRRIPGLGLGSVRGRGEMLELTAQDLAFTRGETEELLVARLGSEGRAVAEACWELTAGWAAALRLLADRLARAEPAAWPAVLDEARRRSGSLWREFAVELLEREAPAAQRILSVAALVPAVDPELLAGLGIDAAREELDSLQSRGLIVISGEHGARAVSPVVAESVTERLPAAEADDIRGRAVVWLERAGRLEEALDAALPGDRQKLLALLRRIGRPLVARGSGVRVAEILRGLEPEAELELHVIRADALVAAGDWDGAMERFADIDRRTGDAALAPATAWRYGALLYLRGETDAAMRTLAAALDEGSMSADDALVSAWLSSTLWSRGEVADAAGLAELALAQATASGDPAARAGAHVAVALAASGRGDREANQRHYRLALAAAGEAGDAVQLARVHANLSSKAVEDAEYQLAIDEADRALTAAAGHDLFGALAIANKAEALIRIGELDEARPLLVQSAEMFTALGSLTASTPYVLMGALDTERGDLARARVSLERARRLAERAGDVHAEAAALCGLSRVLVEEDLDAARVHARHALERATDLERAVALCAAALVELRADELDAARSLAAEAQAVAERTNDRASLARALEIQGAAMRPFDLARIEAAARLWREVGDPIAAHRADMILATARGDRAGAERARDELVRLGVRPDLDVAGTILAEPRSAAGLAIATLGRFVVTRSDGPIPLTAWQSRKARDLLKLLVARRGGPLTRDAAAEALWPEEPPGPLANRLSVALSTLRRVLDPERRYPPDHFIAGDGQSLALEVDHVAVDVIAFLEAAEAGVRLASGGDDAAAEDALRDAARRYAGDFLEDDLYADWAVDCRERARSAAQEVARLLARAALRRGDEEEAVRQLRRLLERDPYDADAWGALMGAQLRLRRYGEARRQHALYARRMAELGLPAMPLASTLEARP
jgi:DNA-binding SARP family transcriptional activator